MLDTKTPSTGIRKKNEHKLKYDTYIKKIMQSKNQVTQSSKIRATKMADVSKHLKLKVDAIVVLPSMTATSCSEVLSALE